VQRGLVHLGGVVPRGARGARFEGGCLLPRPRRSEAGTGHPEGLAAPRRGPGVQLQRRATRFNRLEGAFFKGGAFWFDDTAGGEDRLGQIYRYLPATNTIELYYEGTDKNRLESPDNVVVTPWGDLWVAEDGAWGNRIVGFTPEGHSYVFAHNRVPLQSSPGVPSGEPVSARSLTALRSRPMAALSSSISRGPA
jgi:hypothetical protein